MQLKTEAQTKISWHHASHNYVKSDLFLITGEAYILFSTWFSLLTKPKNETGQDEENCRTRFICSMGFWTYASPKSGFPCYVGKWLCSLSHVQKQHEDLLFREQSKYSTENEEALGHAQGCSLNCSTRTSMQKRASHMLNKLCTYKEPFAKSKMLVWSARV